MYPLPAQTVHLVLRYISPLTDSLPPHLVSAPLRQRHHFLQISPSSTVEYLCWPSSDNAKTVDLLDRSLLLFDQASYSTRYTSDRESTFAHVQISSDPEALRMLFHWDDVHGWMYHDLRLMPFPSLSSSTPQESHGNSSACRASLSLLPSPDLLAEDDHISSGSHDSYWDSYGVAVHDLTSPLPPRSELKLDVTKGEDVYWAQYATVQGSADSTHPSPPSINRKLPSANSYGSALPLPQNDLIIDVPVDTIHPRRLASTLGPPSPKMLARLLSTISPRKDMCPPGVDDRYSPQSPSTYSVEPSPEQTVADSELVTPPLPNEYLDASVLSPDVVEVNGVPLSSCRPRLFGEARDKALTESIKGLYHLWRAGRKEPDENDRSAFLRIVQAAVVYEQVD